MTSLPPPSSRWIDRRGVKPGLVVAAVVVIVGLAWYFWPSSSATPAAPGKGAESGKGAAAKGGQGKGGRFGADPTRVQPVAAATARRGDINIVQTGLGTATALKTVTVRPRVDGLLKSVDFAEGQLVKAGDTIAQIDPVPFQVALAQVEGQLARDAAQLNNARLDYERYKKLLEQDSIASQQVDAQEAQVKQLEGTVKIDQAMVDNARLNLSYTRITAPQSGRLGLRQVDAGNMVRGSDTNGIAIITQVDPITVLFTIPQDNLPRVITRLKAGEKPGVEAWDREQKNLLAKGTLITIDNQIDVTTGTVRLKAEFPNGEGKLYPNQFVNVRMAVDVRRDVVVIPTAGVQRGAQGTVAYIVKEDNSVTLRPVTVGPTEGFFTAIESGVNPGERVVTDGLDRIREGSKVEVTEATPTGSPVIAPPKGGGRRGEGKGDWKGKSGEGKGEGRASDATGKPTEAPPGSKPGAPVKDVPERSQTPRGEAAQGEGFKKRLENMDPAKREEFLKRWQSMTPEQKEEMKKRRRESQ
jgi:multidrug efflux system membrane fusion protein